MKAITEQYAEELINFAPTERAKKMGFAESQLHGAVAAFNMLARNGLAYVADEVGMGKTYVALGTMSLLRFQEPGARIVVIAPRENIQLKWIKELGNFVRDNWRHEDNRVKNLHGQPVRPSLACGSIDNIARVLQVNDNVDLFLRSTSFSVAVRNKEGRKRCRARLLPYVPWVDERLLRVRDPAAFRDNYGRVLNAIVPEIDLLVVDEAHNLKHGFGQNVSNRNRVLGLALGHPRGGHDSCPWYGTRVKRVLMLSATPFEYDYRDLYHQLDEFGWGDAQLKEGDGSSAVSVKRLLDDDDERRDVVRRFLIRRVQYLNICGQPHSKNMYRREWRRGGYETFDDPMTLTDPKQRLVVGLIQKKVAEILGDRRFNNSFQIGMLSSFESFMETITRSKQLHASANAADQEGDEGAVFDGDQEATLAEKRGVDSHSLEKVVSSYREVFGRRLPHPKLDATAAHLADAFETGDKALVFVRRIATVSELRGKLDEHYDRWIHRHMLTLLPELKQEVAGIFRLYELGKRGLNHVEDDAVTTDEEESRTEELAYDLGEDEGGTESFFAWFFRGAGPKKMLSGAAFQKNRLANVSSAYATLFEDNHVAWLLGRPTNVFEALCQVTRRDPDSLRRDLRRQAFAYFRKRTERQDGYPRLYVFEAYQMAGLLALESSQSKFAHQAGVVLRERYDLGLEPDGDPPPGFPEPVDALGTVTLFTELAKRGELRARIWPDEEGCSKLAERFRRREQRRELISAMARLGASYIDLYLLAIKSLGSFELRVESSVIRPVEELITRYLDLLNSQMEESRQSRAFNAFYELSESADAFDTLVAVNFPEVRDAPLAECATIFGRALQHQEPVGRMFGGVNKRLVKQFRMPGYPLVLATTDVLQEGEDLHTFCRKVIHYGITWTPSAMEQRTGRVDRIGSLAQRRLDGSDREPDRRELIQVHYPHLADTVERLQVRRVLERLNEFLRLIHRTAPRATSSESKVDVPREILRAEDAVPRLEGLLESDFPVSASWLRGERTPEDIGRLNLEKLADDFDAKCRELAEQLGIDVLKRSTRRRFLGQAAVARGNLVAWNERDLHLPYRKQPFQLELRSQSVGDATLIRCTSPIGLLDLRDDSVVDELYELQRRLGMVRVCARFDAKHHRHHTSVELDRLFHIDTTQQEELVDMVVKTVLAADSIEEALLGQDSDSAEWRAEEEESGDA